MKAFWKKGGVKSSKGSGYAVVNRNESSFVRKDIVDHRVGRPNCLDNEKMKKLLSAYYAHPYSFRELADMFGVSRMTIWRAVQTSQNFHVMR